ncbi:hypothetical protein AGMMS49965_03480 [Bacteroidia bacterium]|nr:hypothetical protein AGMMS49965_03480 [Bacteroidia bacterium]
MKKLSIFLLAATLAVFSTCNDDDATTPVTGIDDDATTPVTGIELDVPELGLQGGEEYTLTATVQPEDASNKAVRWTSSDETKATVVDGKVTVTMPVEDVTTFEYVTITATAGNKADTCNLVIYPIPTPDNANETEVVINGVTWATCNVDAPGTFAATPDAPGKLYQWNRKKAWAATGTVSDWSDTNATGSTWESSNDPSPEGWRIPTEDELQTLRDGTKVVNSWAFNGRIFIDKSTYQILVLPAVGHRTGTMGTLYQTNMVGVYWSNRASGTEYAYTLGYGTAGTSLDGRSSRSGGHSIRCVKK